MNKLSAFAAAAVIGLSSAAANATVTDLGPITAGIPTSFAGIAAPGGFADYFTFILPSNAGSGYSVSNFTLLPALYTTLLSTLTLVSNADGIIGNGDDSLVSSSVVPGGGSIVMSVAAKPAGKYYLYVTGITTGPSGGIYNGAISAAVPEPETYAMMLAGLCAVGFMAVRRKSRG